MPDYVIGTYTGLIEMPNGAFTEYSIRVASRLCLTKYNNVRNIGETLEVKSYYTFENNILRLERKGDYAYNPSSWTGEDWKETNDVSSMIITSFKWHKRTFTSEPNSLGLSVILRKKEE